MTNNKEKTEVKELPKIEAAPTTYKVKEKDTLFGISQKLGVSVGVLRQLNPNIETLLENPEKEIKIKG